MSDETKQSVVEEGAEFEGAVKTSRQVSVRGKFKGEVIAPQLIVSRTGCVDGQVMVDRLESEGEISGEIAAEKIELSGRVRDGSSITATTLEVKLGQPSRARFGHCKLTVGDPRRGRSDRTTTAKKQESDPTDTPELVKN